MKAETWIVGALVAGAIAVAQALVEFRPEAVTDWRAWAVGIAGAFVRQAAVYVVTSTSVQRLLGRPVAAK